MNSDTGISKYEAKFRELLDIAPGAMIVFNRDREILLVNKSSQKMFGYAGSEMVGRCIEDFVPSLYVQHSGSEEKNGSCAPEKYLVQGREFLIRRRDGGDLSVEIGLNSLETPDGLLTIAVLWDISERIKYKVQLAHQASHDCLTQLPNRNLLVDRLDQALLYAERYHRSVAVMFADLDHFQIINDSLGHDVGDRLLQTVAGRFSGCIRASDTVGRQGGDDFLFVITDVAEESDIARLAQKILAAVDQPLEFDSHDLHVTCSIGISVYPKDGKDSQTLLKNADVAMFRAKEYGRNTYQFFTHHLSDKVSTRMTLEKHLRRALINHELSLCYQPQLELASGRMIGAEALLRWHNPELGDVPPATFIPLAEETGLIIPIGEWVLRTACKQNSLWQQAGLPALTMAVNLSPRQFWNPGLITSVTQILRETCLDPSFLELEITESMVMRDMSGTASMLKELKRIGVKLSIDDFGTGYSSLNHLRSFPFDKLKMDMSFVREITHDPGCAAIAKTIISLGHNLNLQVIAEGVETKAQLSYLRKLGCDEMQGFFFSKPVPAEEYAQLLLEDRHLNLPKEESPHTKTLLLIDDEEIVIEALARILHSQDYRILSATCADEGFNQLALNQVDVILCDQKMPGMSGIEFFSRVKELYPATVRIAMSGYADAEMVATAINQAGIYKFLLKPIPSGSLIETLERAFTLNI